MNDFLINAIGVTKEFKDRVLFKDISLKISKGDSYFIQGPSGSGKSVFLKGLVGLIPFTAGEIEYYELLPFPQIRSKIHYMGQFPSHTEGKVKEFIQKVFELSVYKEITFDEKELTSRLHYFGFDESILKKEISFLSGGEFQIIRLIRSLLLKPYALLLDESSSAMDIALKNKYEDLLIDMNKKGLAILSVSHDQGHLDRLKSQRIKIS